VSQCYARAAAAPRGRLDTAKATARTSSAPLARSALAQAVRVAPVVTTSSTRTTRLGGRAAALTRGGEPSRSRRERPTWRAPWRRRRHRETGRPVRCPTATASRSAGSNPRQARRRGSAGTGTRAPSRSSSGASAAVRSAARPTVGSRRLNLIAATSSLATPSYGRAAQARSSDRIRRYRPAPSSISRRHVGHSSEAAGLPQAQQHGGARIAAKTVGIERFRRIATISRQRRMPPPTSRLIGAYRQ
jgi:hypothetical protein